MRVCVGVGVRSMDYDERFLQHTYWCVKRLLFIAWIYLLSELIIEAPFQSTSYAQTTLALKLKQKCEIQTQTQQKQLFGILLTFWIFIAFNIYSSNFLCQMCVCAGSKCMRTISFLFDTFSRESQMSAEIMRWGGFRRMTLNFLAWKMKWHIFATDPNRMTNRVHLANY